MGSPDAVKDQRASNLRKDPAKDMVALKRVGTWANAIAIVLIASGILHLPQSLALAQEPVPPPEPHCDWYVAADAPDLGDGTKDNPWPAVRGWTAREVQPGQVVCVRGGKYQSVIGRPFRIALTGTEEAPIKVMAYPGERVILDGATNSPTAEYDVRVGPSNVYTLVLAGAYTWVMNFEITSSADEDRQDMILDGRGPTLSRGRGLAITGRGNKFINSIIHNTASSAIFVPGNPPNDAPDMEIYGLIAFDNGWSYPQHIRGGGGGHGLYLDGNRDPAHPKKVRSSYIGLNFGDFGAQLIGGPKGFVLENNVFMKRALVGSNRQDVVFAGNKFWRAEVQGAGQGVTLQDNVGINNSTGRLVVPEGPQIFLEPNQYDPDRAQLTIYNPQGLDQMDVDLSILGWPVDSYYELRSLADYHHDIATGMLIGQWLTVDMRAEPHTVSIPFGWHEPLMANPFPRFGAFIIRRVQPPPPPPPPPDPGQ